jgi:tRNA threonylcarbamoyladenosine biosynthesis protein TsaE
MAELSPAATDLTLESDSANSTERIARTIASVLRPGDVVLVEGEVGTGKTTFVRGACAALGVREPVTSPSFTIGHRYSGEVPVSHVDLFRLETLDSEDPGLLDDYITPDAVAFIEWPESATGTLDPRAIALRIRISHGGGDLRSLMLHGRQEIVDRIGPALRRSR